jgi:hypothetical protein
MGLNGSALGAQVASELVRADVRRRQQCLDALIAAYLKLKGPDGLPLIEQQFLTNPQAENTHVYATIMALRFHGEETDVLPRERLLQTMRLVLNNPDSADQVIPDLARWEDWSVLDLLVAKFKASEENGWIRQPVISYLLAAAEQPADVGQRANAALVELEKLDPEGVKRARSYMAFSFFARPAEETTVPGQENTTTAVGNSGGPVEELNEAPQTSSNDPAESESRPAPLASTIDAPSPLTLISVPLIACLLLMGLFSLLLRSTDVRGSIDGS